MGTFPTEITTEAVAGVNQPITIAEYNTWANSWNTLHPNDTVPLQPTTSGAAIVPTLQTIRNNVNATRSNGGAGGLPLDFFHTQLPQGFATRDPLTFDIRTLQEYKLYRIRQTYDANFGTLTGSGPNTLPRYIQFGIRVFF